MARRAEHRLDLFSDRAQVARSRNLTLLEDAAVGVGTGSSYQVDLQDFRTWEQGAKLPKGVEPESLDAHVTEYFDILFWEGFGQEAASRLLAAIGHADALAMRLLASALETLVGWFDSDATYGVFIDFSSLQPALTEPEHVAVELTLILQVPEHLIRIHRRL